MHQFYQTHTDIRVLSVTTSLPVKFRVKCIEVARIKVLLRNAECFPETGGLK